MAPCLDMLPLTLSRPLKDAVMRKSQNWQTKANNTHGRQHMEVQSHGKLFIACVDHLLESLRVERVNLEAVKHSFEAQKVAFQAEKESFEAAQAEQAKHMEQAVGTK